MPDVASEAGDPGVDQRRVMPQIDTIIVLMLENRSLDSMLGWLHADGAPVRVVPEGSEPPAFDGIPHGVENVAFGAAHAPARGREALGEQRWRVPRQDPREALADVFRQMYGDGDGITSPLTWADEAPMTGFASDFERMLPPDVGEVMGAYTHEELPVLYELAERFAVSDRWFSSVPTETTPNRAFAFCGTSEGKETDADRPLTYSSPTIFNALNATGTTWAIYAQTDVAGIPFTNGGATYSELVFDGVRSALAEPDHRGAVLPYESLLDCLRDGWQLPSFCWIEPSWGWGLGDEATFVGRQGNDYHPPTWVGPAEADLAALFEAIVTSRHWPNLLFVVTFDEHGGTWDHVPPPRAVNPDGRVGPSGFAFERFGPRVPALLISPFIEPRTVVRPPVGSTAPFDHTSIIKTVLAWAGADDDSIAAFGRRVADAPMFDHALGETVVQPHPTIPTVPAGFASQCTQGSHLLPEAVDGRPIAELKHIAAECSTLEEFVARLDAEPRPP